jgi:hypothetical protein
MWAVERVYIVISGLGTLHSAVNGVSDCARLFSFTVTSMVCVATSAKARGEMSGCLGSCPEIGGGDIYEC